MAPHSSTLAWKIPWMKEPLALDAGRRAAHVAQGQSRTRINIRREVDMDAFEGDVIRAVDVYDRFRHRCVGERNVRLADGDVDVVEPDAAGTHAKPTLTMAR